MELRISNTTSNTRADEMVMNSITELAISDLARLFDGACSGSRNVHVIALRSVERGFGGAHAFALFVENRRLFDRGPNWFDSRLNALLEMSD